MGEKMEKEKNGEVEKGEKRGRKRKAKQYKVGVTEKGNTHLNEFLEKANKSARRRINVPDVMEYIILKLSDKDIPKVQERVLTLEDRTALALEQYNLTNPDKPLTMEEFKTSMFEVFDKHVLSKLGKGPKAEQLDAFG